MIKSDLRLLNQTDAAKILGISVRTPRNWDKHPHGPPRRKIGKRYYYQRGRMLEWLEAAKDPKKIASLVTTFREPSYTY